MEELGGEELGGACLNEELCVTVSYSSGPKGRQSRVRRTRRPPIDELWETSLAEVGDELGYQRMSAFCNYASINLEAALSAMESDQGFRAFGERISIVSYADVVHARFLPFLPTGPRSPDVRDAFIFPYGAVLLWGFTSDQESELLDLFAPCAEEISSHGKVGELSDCEFMLFRPLQEGDEEEGEAQQQGPPPLASITNNVVRLRSDDATERLAISFAFAQSAKLSVLEASLEALSEEIKAIPEQLARTGRSSFSAKRIAQLSGRIFLQRNEANLYANILDCPAFFWEAEAFEPLYRRVNTYLDVEDRVGILNNKLDIVNDLLESLGNQLEIRNAHRLEWIIIILIMIEIGLDLLKEIEMGPVGLVTGLLRRVVLRRAA